MNLRNSAKAIIIENGHLLVTKNRNDQGEFYLLPGGGQNHGETLHDALRRECREEISAEIMIGELLCIREYISKNHEFAEVDPDAHQIEFMFLCSITHTEELKEGTVPDIYQTGVEWIPVDKIHEFDLYPKSLRKVFAELIRKKPDTVYFGDVN